MSLPGDTVGHLEPVPPGPALALARVSLATVLREWAGSAAPGFGGPPTHIKLLRALADTGWAMHRQSAGPPPPPAHSRQGGRRWSPGSPPRPARRLCKRRAALVEPAFARFGRYLNYRGRDAASTEIKLPGTVRNLGKLLDHRRRHPATAT